MRRFVAITIAAIVIAPLVGLILWSGARSWPYPDLLPAEGTTRGLDLVTSSGSWEALVTSVVIATSVAILSSIIGLPAGRVIGLHRFRGRRLVQLCLIAPVIVPGIAVTLGLQVFFIRWGLSESILGVVLVQLVLTVPYAATILGAAFEGFDVDLERQARVLGAGAWRATTLVTVPVLAPALAASALLTFLISWSEYILTLLIGGGQVQTLPLMLFAAIGSSDSTAAAALGLLVVAPPVLLVVLISRLLRGRAGLLIGMVRS
ncbi:ABC transporter permease subunit [Aeromicrobium sp.]|uniref:ABC transporter permease n=1 Tax=Aeromicrobium sp. TaxID=1871063 RepID=UPI0030BFA778